MVTPSAGAVILVPFPFSDLSHSKLRPAVVLADAGRDDWVLCQITSKSYAAQKAKTKERGTKPRLRRKPFKESELPPEVQEFRRKFREWHDSFQSRAKRMAYIRKLCKRIAEAYQPEKIILFGSHAYGKPTPESDVDLLIVMDYEWIEKAEGDWDEAQRAYRARKRPNYDAAGFHAQQCVEKYLKAKLNEASLIFDKTHDLAELLKQASTVEPSWSRMAPWRAHAERR